MGTGKKQNKSTISTRYTVYRHYTVRKFHSFINYFALKYWHTWQNINDWFVSFNPFSLMLPRLKSYCNFNKTSSI